MDKERYVAYVGTYTHGSSIGIHLYDIDMEQGTMTERKVVPINNSSHLTKAHNKQFLYSISDEGVEAFRKYRSVIRDVGRLANLAEKAFSRL